MMVELMETCNRGVKHFDERPGRGGARRCQLRKSTTCAGEILLVPEWMVEAHRLAPIRHDEIGIELLCRPEVCRSIVMDLREKEYVAAAREMKEEIGTDKAKVLQESGDWFTYDLPDELIPKIWNGRFRGQRNALDLWPARGGEGPAVWRNDSSAAETGGGRAGAFRRRMSRSGR